MTKVWLQIPRYQRMLVCFNGLQILYVTTLMDVQKQHKASVCVGALATAVAQCCNCVDLTTPTVVPVVSWIICTWWATKCAKLNVKTRALLLTHTGPPTLTKLTPEFVALSPPSHIVLEIEVTGYSHTWLVNGTNMHSLNVLSLRASQRFILVNTRDRCWDIWGWCTQTKWNSQHSFLYPAT